MDIVWLKRDVRLQDHGPFAEVAKESKTPILILYLYEPDQLAEPTVHGSHLYFVHEGLVDLERRLLDGNINETFDSLTICHNAAIDALKEIHKSHGIKRLLAHQETGHWQSFMRDKMVRKWCKSQQIPFIEFNHTGVTRCLKHRDDYLKNFKAFVSKPRYATPITKDLKRRTVVLKNLTGYLPNIHLDLSMFTEIPEEHRVDRSQRQQQGGTRKALATLDSFLQTRGSQYSQGISSPNTSWTSCSRLSPYITWGHISLRQTIHSLQERQEQLRRMQKQGRNIGTWLRSLQAFSSRLHWRSHFIQKLESEPIMEKQDVCPAYQPLRRQDGDWNPDFYVAWRSGKTGFPYVDACMRCLNLHGWINFRARAMLVSFATYNLWLDWKKLAPHLARVFLDYEPGIHYPQLQMQAGTTGINAMRVYSVTKQGKDQDPDGKFIKKYVPELQHVPLSYVHEPSKMPLQIQSQCNTKLGSDYPNPIVNEQESAKLGKSKVAAIRNLVSTRQLANQVYQKHGSRNTRQREDDRKPKALSSTMLTDEQEPSKQTTIRSLFPKQRRKDDSNTSSSEIGDVSATKSTNTTNNVIIVSDELSTFRHSELTEPENSIKRHFSSSATKNTSVKRQKQQTIVDTNNNNQNHWSCKRCTFLNDKPLGLLCNMCHTPRGVS